MQRNHFFTHVSERYLFQEIRERKAEFLSRNPLAKLISLSIGDTTEEIPPHICEGLTSEAKALGTAAGYKGYGPEQGSPELQQAIAKKIYGNKVAADDIFVSDGAKCDIGRLQILFGPNVTIALQDPAYPAYLDTASIYRGKDKIILLPCLPENGFFPDLEPAKKADVLFLCAPNNPTGAPFTFEQLRTVVAFAKKHQKVIVYDTAYSLYIQDSTLPRSIYEIEGAQEVAIEISSFSKMAGFSGVRLGWTVIPHTLRYSSGEPVKPDWMRIITTFYNGASIISQKGGIAAMSDTGFEEMKAHIRFYLENAALLRSAFTKLGYEVFGGENAPYLWIKIPGKSSWQAFEELLEKAHIISTPGIGFGASGEGFLRISCFGKRATIEEAVKRLGVLKSKYL
jgi:LL-diaminopimelate aminotransferase